MRFSHNHVSSRASSSSLPIRFITFNVRYATQSPVVGEQPWSVRCPKVGAQLRFATTGHDTAFVCLQEVLHQQVLDIHEQLGRSDDDFDGWAYIGRGRDDGHAAGEYSPIFYRPHVWRCEQSRMYWLSETPERPSRGWDAVLPRIVTVGLFQHRVSEQTVVVMSTHFDHIGVRARQESASLILRIADVWRNVQGDGLDGAGAQKTPVFLGGDFNSTPDDGAYRTMTAPGAMADMAHLVPTDRRYGNAELTYTSFGEPGETPKRIDFLFVRDPAPVRILTAGLLSNRFDDGVFLSDHRAVIADVEIPVRM